MPDVSTIDLGRPARRLRVDTLVRLRWLAVVGQMIALLVVHYGLGFPLPLGWCFLVIASSCVLNICLRVKFGVSHRFEDEPAMVLLAYDVVQLSLLLFLTGGLENPFSMLFLAPVMISAASLSPYWTLLLGLFTGAAATILVFKHLPLPWFPDQQLELPFLYSAGVWVAIISGTAFTGVYASRVAEEARLLSDALAATELVLAREQHLTQLDGIAAAVGHELGTPLATITLVVKELIQLAKKPGFTFDMQLVEDDLALLDQQVRRCRTILGKLASLDDEKSGPLEEMTLPHVIEEVADPQRNFGVDLSVAARGDLPEPVCLRNPGILYGLGNLVENAIDFARTSVQIHMVWTRDRVAVSIEDDGPGFSPDVLARLGEPYVTTRGPSRRAKSEEGSGLGLGLFIAKTLLERSGASLSMGNAHVPATGAIVTITWPRIAFERGSGPRNKDKVGLSAAMARLP
ncbi:ActS/PrrB/RegB family redox-sensitive histidine kinase [Lichenihabitans psoromatis]|uniref:ActS/PrrB/RegB family redox-sensitive histidine kinase n=1 Tax=Lichenihabitans psoromatis TaxID=2528642 RepID=UPI001038496A|nr:ActS/PrrB/RegB family redox-sensitive histidine kinase [Lichenihabitans psoromatis]